MTHDYLYGLGVGLLLMSVGFTFFAFMFRKLVRDFSELRDRALGKYDAPCLRCGHARELHPFMGGCYHRYPTDDDDPFCECMAFSQIVKIETGAA